MIVCKYKFDKSIYENFIPVFNDGYNGYTVTDEIDSENSNYVIRTIECDTLPTYIKFGDSDGMNFSPQRNSLLELIYLNTINIKNMSDMFAQCINLTSINTEGWDTSNVINMRTVFYNCKKLTSLDISNFNTSNVTSMYAMFYNCTNLTSLDLSNFDTSKVTNMNQMFNNCNNLTSLDVSNFNTSNVTNMGHMFDNCKSLTQLDVSNWDTSKVTDMNYMFSTCTNLTSLDVSNWNVSKVVSMNYIFASCRSLTTIDVSRWDVKNVESLYAMFGSTVIETVDISNWNFTKAVHAYAMFHKSGIKHLRLCEFPFGIQYIHYTFLGCTQLEEVNLNSLDLSNIIMATNVQGYDIFGMKDSTIVSKPNNIAKITSHNLNTIEILLKNGLMPDRSSNEVSGKLVTSLRDKIEADEEMVAALAVANWEITDLVAEYKYDANIYEDLMPEFNTEFSSDKYEVNDSVSEIVIDNIQWIDGYLNGSDIVEPSNTIVYSKYYTVQPNTKYVMEYQLNYHLYDENKIMIERAISVQEFTTTLNIKYVRFCKNKNDNTDIITAKLITRSIESINGDLPTLMRFGRVWVDGESTTDNRTDSLLKVLDMNTSELTNCNSMFRFNKNLTSITCEWNTSNVTEMSGMFRSCLNLTSLDVSNFDTSKVTSMNSTFYGCNKLTSLDVSNFNTSNVTNMQYVFQDCSNLTSLDVSNFNTSNVTSMRDMFCNCGNLTSLDVSNFNTSKVTNMYQMFYDCIKLTELDVSNFDTSKVTNMYAMFRNCQSLTSLDLSNWNTSNVTSINSMFRDCRKLESINVSNWDTNNVTTMSNVFNGCNNLTSLDVSNFNTSNVTNMQYVFQDCSNLTSLDVSNWDTSKVTSMNSTFYGCNKLTSLDVSNWDTSNVTTMSNMFYNCYNLTQLDVSNWDTSNVTDMNRLFHGCINLKRLDTFGFETNKVTDMENMFAYLQNLLVLNISNMIISDDTNINNIFIINSNGSMLKYIKCDVLDTLNKLVSQFIDRTSLEQGIMFTSLDISTISSETLSTLQSKNWTVVTSDTLTKVAEYVYDSKIWNSLIPTFNDEFVKYFIDDVEDENGLVTRVISSMGGLPTLIRFGQNEDTNILARCLSLMKVLDINCYRLNTLNTMFKHCENCDYICKMTITSIVSDITNAFCDCKKLTSLDVSNWDTSNVTIMSGFVARCTNLTSLDLSNWDTSNVTTMTYMFQGCTNLTSLDVGNWNTSNVTVMTAMFNNCTKLTSLNISNWNTSNVKYMSGIFSNTPLLTDIGMLYCTPSTINTIASNLPTTHTRTIWVQDADINKLTSVSGVEFKEYKENGYMINLSSPLLDGDKIEVVDGKLCHYHKMGSVVLNGNENWYIASSQPTDTTLINLYKSIAGIKENSHIICNIFKQETKAKDGNIYKPNSSNNVNIHIIISKSKLIEPNANGFKQWLSENPTTVIYELAEPYYEDITPIQSDIVLETYLESNLDICTKLPIKTNVSYITNVPSLSTLSMRATEMKESDNIIANLTNMLDNEINE